MRNELTFAISMKVLTTPSLQCLVLFKENILFLEYFTLRLVIINQSTVDPNQVNAGAPVPATCHTI